ncbi:MULTISPECIES: bifunctional diaminohydroxyphosphoribosylaminopyrimidine deaminase/5-amino-6-(5-phosphoribosylamino)uracil reductase RibD [Halomonas]|uniref:bifunctional diaminohydroxyphosphoribosylaminopyrimidine deaminase/5-amino-6-(5-phosphoribosylamino)uracil reductase RibD n=1 Tax=Halomonas TaxID=2745 RepID=UPI001C94A6E0|nr:MULTISPECIES: bifunctional diaminohydroxyphosphoribosylaminopyrimidine deaminase/5-amino-6-(5-phosphoribosylamino)uracil reductase RibD [Halomonas]MBY5929814.1 bifunctional diaminohydroxyphosphoribosylaminopyrimidine deaminase/5-amino-6-(5-phosphoribosylamino)uracil reductase RibD [Halomonas sp. DP8Y7-3]MBY5968436.1 bifunctional diaminohydroxyphosphoribosylaminopyrimidine deaminase/5-amino-6-(5-phosphoribosylamino)uracil reductase RibD [Halomonas denitrificans]MBY5984187.1 bifunctional diamin
MSRDDAPPASAPGHDAHWMARALRLAEHGRYTSMPNPRVGCVLVKDGEWLAEGFHERAGEPHAEIHALNGAGERSRGATAYVTLEPCSHHGRTGPCCDALIKAGVARVVVAMQDPNPQVAGRGIQRLREAGIEVLVGCLEDDALTLNAGFVSRMTKGRPRVRLKLAMSLDGRTAMASGESQWITGPAARRDVQRLRAQSCAILTGVDSIIFDNSRLTVRAEQLGLDQADTIARRQPLRVVVDSRLRMPLAAACLSEPGQTLVVCVEGVESPRREALERSGARVLEMPAGEDGRVDLPTLLDWLGREEGCNELLVETGATLAGAMMDACLVDELRLYMAPTLLGPEARGLMSLSGIDQMAHQRPLEIIDIRALGQDWRILARPALPACTGR